MHSHHVTWQQTSPTASQIVHRLWKLKKYLTFVCNVWSCHYQQIWLFPFMKYLGLLSTDVPLVPVTREKHPKKRLSVCGSFFFHCTPSSVLILQACCDVVMWLLSTGAAGCCHKVSLYCRKPRQVAAITTVLGGRFSLHRPTACSAPSQLPIGHCWHSYMPRQFSTTTCPLVPSL